MQKKDLTRLLIETTVSRILKDMERDGPRSCRKLLDLALRFCPGPFESHLLALCRDALDAETSRYHQLAGRMLQDVDREYLIHLGVNLGYEAGRRGAQRIRQAQAREGLQVPWAMVLEMERGSRAVSRQVLQEAGELGCRVYAIRDCGLDWQELEQLLQSDPNAFFAVLASTENALHWNLARLAAWRNLLMVVPQESEVLCRRLEAERMPYAVSLRYRDPSVLRQLEELPPRKSLAAILIADDAPEPIRQSVYASVLESRRAGTYPFVPLELEEDIMAISRIVSGRPLGLQITPSGAVQPYGIPASPSWNIRRQPLRQILAQAYAR